MKLAALLARKDLVQTARDRLSFIFILVMPLAFTLFFGVLFGANSSSQKLPLAVWDADGAAAAKQLVTDLGKSAVVRTVAVNGSQIEQQIADNKAAAGLIIPAGYSQAVADGGRAQLTIVATQGSSGAATAASEIRALAGDQVTVELAARAAVAALGLKPGTSAGAQGADQALRQARQVAAQTLATPAASTKVVAAGAAANQTPSGFVLSSPGMMVNFILFSLMTAGIALIVERQNGTLQRLMTTRLRRWELIGGKAAGMFCLTFAQQIILIGVAQVFFGVDYLRDPAALLVMMVSLSLVASTLGLLLASSSRASRRSSRRRCWCRWPSPRSPAPGSHSRSPGRRSRAWGTCCRRPGSSTGCAGSSCAGSTSPTCCPRSRSRWRGPPGSSPPPSGASASAIDHVRPTNVGGAAGAPHSSRPPLRAGLSPWRA